MYFSIKKFFINIYDQNKFVLKSYFNVYSTAYVFSDIYDYVKSTVHIC